MNILGLLFYTLFTNELPEVILQNPGPSDQSQDWPQYTMIGEGNSSVCCYADDSTLTVGDSDPALLSNKLSEKYCSISQGSKDCDSLRGDIS